MEVGGVPAERRGERRRLGRGGVLSALAHLRAAGLEPRLDGGRLLIGGPAALVAEHRGYVAEHKAELLAELTPHRVVVAGVRCALLGCRNLAEADSATCAGHGEQGVAVLSSACQHVSPSSGPCLRPTFPGIDFCGYHGGRTADARPVARVSWQETRRRVQEALGPGQRLVDG